MENVAAWCKSINNTVSAAGEADSKIIPKRFQNTPKHRCQGYENNCHLGTFSGLSLAVNALSFWMLESNLIMTAHLSISDIEFQPYRF